MKHIITQFIKEESVQSNEVFGAGHIHDTYKVETTEGNFILQRINTTIFKDVLGVMQNIEQVASHLQQQGDYPMEILSPCYSKEDKSYYQDSDDSYWRMFPFIENTKVYVTIEQPEQAYPIAYAFGTFIGALSDLSSEKLAITLPDFHNGLYRLGQLKNAIPNATPSRLQLAKESLDFILQEEAVFKEVAVLKLPTRIVHNDTKADNILLDKEHLQAKCVIDLDTVMPGTLLSDFGDMVRTCTNSEVEDSDNFSAITMQRPIYEALETGFLDALQDSINPEERSALYLGAKWIILEQAVRFLADFLNNDSYYKTHYPMHNLVRTKNQIMLYRSLIR